MLCSYASYYQTLCSGLGTIICSINRLSCLEFNLLCILLTEFKIEYLYSHFAWYGWCFLWFYHKLKRSLLEMSKVCQYLKLSHYALKQSDYAQLCPHLFDYNYAQNYASIFHQGLVGGGLVCLHTITSSNDPHSGSLPFWDAFPITHKILGNKLKFYTLAQLIHDSVKTMA